MAFSPSPSRPLLLEGVVLTPGRELPHASVLVEDGRIAWVRPGRHAVAGARRVLSEGDAILPGFIDLQVNGVAGADAPDGREAIAAISRSLPRHGVTGFLPTLISRPPEEGARFVREVAAASADGARILGAHLEGPFLNPRLKGAHDEDILRAPAPGDVDTVLADRPRLVTLAPELPGGLEAVRALAGAGVVVSAGHSAATYEETVRAIDAGVRFATHVFNAMGPLHHRDPGIVGAVLTDPRITVGLIADGVHVHPATAAVVLGAKRPGGVALTSDQTAAAGLPRGHYRVGGMDVESDGVVVRQADGTLAGSASTMDQLVRLVAGLPGHGLREAAAMASLSPARVLGLDGRLGHVRAGSSADLVVLDAERSVRLTMVAGRIVYNREEDHG